MRETAPLLVWFLFFYLFALQYLAFILIMVLTYLKIT
ncbi:hypothetical protein Q787_03990 [Ornithobacterium rhinotracheale H06-030791]|nr:hypothetical protein Q785_04115 [Ornithobacterium rhinotracheale ORT-UMN 88]AIQ00604.1 hypothetical protein Q785_08085 [Ornithobacterium rhinotracheale ORT-UMN 88]KGB67322.1 hypothetical protein Q787_03990 [Ornithobacterium rhinotracheale H06-030791]